MRSYHLKPKSEAT